MSVTTKKLTGNNIDLFIALLRVFGRVFEMDKFSMPAGAYLEKLLGKKDFLVFVALSGNKVVGGLTAYTLQQYYSTSPLVYIYDVAVETEYQRRGIGKNLIAAILQYGKENGMEEVFVQADMEDGYALDFYRSTGGVAEQVVHFSYPLKP